MMQEKNIQIVKIFSERLASLRGSMKKAEFARFLDIKSPVTYQNYEDGRIPDAGTLIHIAGKCGVTVDWLLGRGESEKKELPKPTENELRIAGLTTKRMPWVTKITDEILLSEIMRFAEKVVKEGVSSRPGNAVMLLEYVEELLRRQQRRLGIEPTE